MTISKRPSNPQSSLNALAEQIGHFIEYWGFKKIHGQIWTHLYLSPSPLSAQDIISRLKVSKALVSLSMKDLLHYKLILQTEESVNKKNKFYTANPEVFSVIRGVLETREHLMLTRILTEFKNLEEIYSNATASNLIDHERMKLLGKMVKGASSALQNIILLTNVDFSFLNLFKRTTNVDKSNHGIPVRVDRDDPG
jgi:DNA-binding transcriptional regulator GbsR (MarR family)